MDNNMDNFYLVIFKESSGDIEESLSALGHAQLVMYALTHLKPGRNAIVFNLRTGEVHSYFERESKDSFPEVTKGEELEYKHINDYCPGLLEAVGGGANG